LKRWVFLATLGACVAALPIHALASNLPPTADFVVRAGESGPTSVLFDATASSDPDGTIRTYQWVFGDGTTGSGVTNRHTYPSISSYRVTLVVTDSGGASHLVNRTIDLSQPLAPSTPAVSVVRPPTAANVPVGTYVGARAPEFALPDLKDAIVRLSDFLGRVVLLEFWSSGCPACVAALPYLESLRRTYGERGLMIVDVITNSNYLEAQNLLAKGGHAGFVTLREVDSTAKPTMALYGVVRVPHAFLIDRTGVIRFSGHLSLLREELIAAWL